MAIRKIKGVRGKYFNGIFCNEFVEPTEAEVKAFDPKIMFLEEHNRMYPIKCHVLPQIERVDNCSYQYVLVDWVPDYNFMLYALGKQEFYEGIALDMDESVVGFKTERGKLVEVFEVKANEIDFLKRRLRRFVLTKGIYTSYEVWGFELESKLIVLKDAYSEVIAREVVRHGVVKYMEAL